VSVHYQVAVVQMEAFEILLDKSAFVPACHNEVIQTGSMINGHDVPENGLPADFHHRFGTDLRLFAETCPPPTGQQHNLHERSDFE